MFGENDPARRRAAIDEIFIEDSAFYDPQSGAHGGRDEIDRVAGAIKATHPDFRYQLIAEPEELGNAGGPVFIGSPPVKRRLTPGRISPLPVTDGLPLSIFFDKLP